MAHVIEVPERAMLATDRCDRCGAQAYMEVAIDVTGKVVDTFDRDVDTCWTVAQRIGKTMTLMFCAHHGAKHEEALKAKTGVLIADHRKQLQAQEAGPRDAASAAQ